jgi:predicted transcriptional regulator
MASEIVNLTVQIVMSHAATTELTPKELVAEIKQIHQVLSSLDLEGEVVSPKTMAPPARRPKPRRVKMVESAEAKAIQDEEGPDLGDPDYMDFMSSREG